LERQQGRERLPPPVTVKRADVGESPSATMAWSTSAVEFESVVAGTDVVLGK